jgi:hypothetical protein
VKQERTLLIALITLFAVGCDGSVASPPQPAPEATDPVGVDEPEDEGTTGMDDADGSESSSSGGFDETGEPAETDGWESPTFDLGGGAWEPAFSCDDANAIIPEGVECEDAIPGDQAPFEVQQAVAEAFGETCVLERKCGEQWGIDCQSAVDGPYHYVAAETLELIATCGGACQAGPCDDCPPDGWVCPVY